MLTALLAGARVCLLDPQGAGARRMLEVVRSEAVTILFAFPALMRSLLAAGDAPGGDDLRMVRLGGDTLLWSDVGRLRAWLGPEAAIQLVYAATEAPMMQWFVADAARDDDARVPIGYPLAGAPPGRGRRRWPPHAPGRGRRARGRRTSGRPGALGRWSLCR